MAKDGLGRLLLLHVAALSTAGAVATAAVLRRRYRRKMMKELPAPAMAEMPKVVIAEHGHVEHIEKFSHYVARQMGFEDVNECPQLCKVANNYLKKTKNCMDDIYDLLANVPDAESLYVKLVEELDKCILGYFAFHWDLCTTLISQALTVDSATKKKLRNLVLEATRKQRFERVTKDLKVTRVFSTLVDEMKAIGIVPGMNGDEEAQCTDVMAPVAHADRSPVLLLMGGGMGAGKSTVLKEILEEPFWTEAGANALVVEADAFKETDVIYRAISSMGHHNDMLQTAELNMELCMAELQCPICLQPVRNCGRSDRRSTSFETVMLQGFLHGGNVPCKCKVNMDSFAARKWIVATDRWNRTFDLYLEERWGRRIVCGPYWKTLVRRFGIQLGDVVCFKVADNHMQDEMDQDVEEEFIKFDISVFSVVDNIKQEKPIVSDSVLYAVIPDLRAALRNIVFSEIFDVKEHEMAAINFALCKVACMAAARELQEGEFYVKTSEMKYFVHRVNGNNVNVGGLLIPEQMLDGYKYQVEGSSLLRRRGLQHPIQGMYNCVNRRIVFVQGINELLEGENIGEGTLVMVRVDPKPEAICLDLVEVINPV